MKEVGGVLWCLVCGGVWCGVFLTYYLFLFFSLGAKSYC